MSKEPGLSSARTEAHDAIARRNRVVNITPLWVLVYLTRVKTMGDSRVRGVWSV